MDTKLLSLEEAQEETTKLLTSGWRMLAEVCPISQYPLLQNPATGEIWSVRAQMPVMMEASGSQGHAPSDSQDADKLHSAVIGEKLLLGWELLEEEECGVPLMKDTQGKLFSVASNKYVEPDHGMSEVGKPASEEGDTSRRIGERLYLGWEMQNSACQVHCCPLLTDPKTQQDWCPALGNDARRCCSTATEPRDEKASANVLEESISLIVAEVKELTLLLSTLNNVQRAAVLVSLKSAGDTIKKLQRLAISGDILVNESLREVYILLAKQVRAWANSLSSELDLDLKLQDLAQIKIATVALESFLLDE